MTSTPPRRSTLTSFARLDDDAFGDERQQRTWLEAYVVAFEVAVLAAVVLAAVMAWVGDRSLAWWSVGVIWVIGAGNVAALARLRSAGLADLPWRDRLRFWHFRFRLVLVAIWMVGFVRALWGEDLGLADSPWPTLVGMVVGAGLALGATWIADRRARRRATDLPPDDVFDD